MKTDEIGDVGIDEEPEPPSVLDEYRDLATISGSSTRVHFGAAADELDVLLSCVFTFKTCTPIEYDFSYRRDASLQSTLPALRTILANGAPPERMSAELAELLGFHQLELVEKLTARSLDAVQKVSCPFPLSTRN